MDAFQKMWYCSVSCMQISQFVCPALWSVQSHYVIQSQTHINKEETLMADNVDTLTYQERESVEYYDQVSFSHDTKDIL